MTTSKERLFNLVSVCKENLLDIPAGLFLFTDAKSGYLEDPLNQAWLDVNSNEKQLIEKMKI